MGDRHDKLPPIDLALGKVAAGMSVRPRGGQTTAGTLRAAPNRTRPRRSMLHEALETARGQEAKFWELRAASALARLWSSEGRQAEALSLLAPVYGWFTEGFGTLELRSAKALVAELQR